MEKQITLNEAQQMVDGWIKQYGVRYFSELTNMARTYGDQSFKQGENHDLSDEMADILWVLICLANQTGVDLNKAFLKTIEKKTERDKYRHINNPKLNEHGDK